MKMSHKILGCSTIAAALVATTTQAQNLLVDPSFENNTLTANPITLAGVGQGWATFGLGQSDMSAAPIGDNPKDGNYALLGSQASGSSWNNEGAYQIVSANAGTTYTFSAWALTDTPLTGSWGANTPAGYGVINGPVDIQLQFLDSALNSLATFDYGWSPTGAVNTWQDYSISGLAPAGTVYASAYLFFMDNGTTTTAQDLYYDATSLTPAPEPTTLALAGLGGVSLLSLIRRRKS